MKHVTYSEKSLLMGDEAADVLMEYSALLGQYGTADTVTLRCFGADADEVDATFVLNQGSALMAETTHTSMAEPDNTEAVRVMRAKMKRLGTPSLVSPSDQTAPSYYDDFDLEA
ncbi:hypothetical protein FVA74_05195 [Salinibacterium sp. dk2585]|uniref:hypothetical protein n=1 Tax=unclassified Salinibacterium TaxID=2632331 RepID=UPI0011C24AE4|nr:MULTISPECIES: hypothetical protein [unclassified Salinibacterium]QEE61037.1 hypothetical protein FVA74_05195 [Salinibacterium sp. dk2585]TXK52979.1 hypothetical protein FVP63_11315 [Salinibacterium sp. dk5596]